jgi:hypothetical protein
MSVVAWWVVVGFFHDGRLGRNEEERGIRLDEVI